MKIRLQRTWFAPDISGSTSKKYIGRNGRVLARGHRLRRGIHEVPDEWEKLLPSDTQILEGGYKLEDDETEFLPVEGGIGSAHVLQSPTVAEAAVAQLADLTQKAEEARQEEIKANRMANLEKARAARKQKQEEKNADA